MHRSRYLLMSKKVSGQVFPEPSGAMDGGGERTWRYLQRVRERPVHSLFCSLIPLALITLLGGCGEAPPEVPAQCAPTASASQHVAENGLPMDQCDGPQAQACIPSASKTRYFCSTTNLLEWQQARSADMEPAIAFTRDLSDVDWSAHDSGDWVTMQTAWFVIEHGRDNGQGQTPPVGFSDFGDAEIFASKHGGHITDRSGLSDQ